MIMETANPGLGAIRGPERLAENLDAALPTTEWGLGDVLWWRFVLRVADDGVLSSLATRDTSPVP